MFNSKRNLDPPISPLGHTGGQFVPERFARTLAVHCYTAGMDNFGTPLILGIQGPPGDGKSYQTRLLGRAWCFHYSVTSASQFSGTLESEPLRELESLYVSLSTEMHRRDTPGFLLIDDFDLGIVGVRTSRTYTVNTELLTGFFMHLCDDPLLNGRLNRPVPIVITGNDLSVLHKPLIRHGRVLLFEWIPTASEARRVVVQIMKQTLEAQDAEMIYNTFSDQPISFFSEMVSRFTRKRADALLMSTSPFPSFSKFQVLLKDQSWNDCMRDSKPDEFIMIGNEIVEQHQTKSYLNDQEYNRGSDDG